MKLNYLKYYENFKLEPYRNYDERKKYAEEKMKKILQNKIYEGDIDLSYNKYPNIKELGNLEILNDYLSQLSIENNIIIKSLKPLRICPIIFAQYSIIEDIGYIKNMQSLILSYNKKIRTLGEYIKEINYLSLNNTNIKILGSLESCNDIYLNNTKNIKSLYPLKNANYINIKNSNVEDISSLNINNYTELHISEDTKVPKEQYTKFNWFMY